MNQLETLIREYSDYLDTIRYNKQPAKVSLLKLIEESDSMIKSFIEFLASRPVCGVEQRKFLNIIETNGYYADHYDNPNENAIRIPEEESWGPTEISVSSFPEVDLCGVCNGM